MTALPFDPEGAALAWQRLRFALGAAGLGTWHVDLRTGIATHDETVRPAADAKTLEINLAVDESVGEIAGDLCC